MSLGHEHGHRHGAHRPPPPPPPCQGVASGLPARWPAHDPMVWPRRLLHQAALWDLHDQLKAKGNKTIICNDTGQMFACGGKKPCYCDAANKERFYPNVNDLKQVGASVPSRRRGSVWARCPTRLLLYAICHVGLG